MLKLKLGPVAERVVALALLVVALVLVVAFFERLPIEGTSLAIDWKGLWQGLQLQDGRPQYGNATGLRIAPWDVLLVLPLGWLSFRASWGVLTLVTAAVLVVSVPPTPDRRRRWLGIVLLTTSFPALRLIADGNFEALIIAGVLLVVHGYAQRDPWTLAAGILLATAKLQETWVLMLVLGAYILQTWAIRDWLKLGGLLAVVVVPCLIWLGREWVMGMAAILERGSIIDISLAAALARAGLPAWVVAGAWITFAGLTLYLAWTTDRSLSREKAALLIAASLLLAPYSAGNTFLTVLAIGLLPIFMTRPGLGAVLIALTDLPYLASRDMLFNWQAYYWTALLLLTWGVCAGQILRTEVNGTDPSPAR